MIKVPISNGELIDKYTILKIKETKITDPIKCKHIVTELEFITKYVENLKAEYNISSEIESLSEVNLKLWGIEDSIRIMERNKNFNNKFVELARLVYFTNDSRAAIKKQINTLTASAIIETKEYVSYD